jgi:hypothetical protein
MGNVGAATPGVVALAGEAHGGLAVQTTSLASDVEGAWCTGPGLAMLPPCGAHMPGPSA